MNSEYLTAAESRGTASRLGRLIVRHLIIHIAFSLAVAYVVATGMPWPLLDSFELAATVEDQLFMSLGISVRGLTVCAFDLVVFVFERVVSMFGSGASVTDLAASEFGPAALATCSVDQLDRSSIRESDYELSGASVLRQRNALWASLPSETVIVSV